MVGDNGRRAKICWKSSRRMLPLLLACAGCFALAGCSIGGTSFMAPRGSIAASQKWWFFEVILIMLVVVGPVLVLTPLFALKYRHGRKTTYTPDWGAASLRYELVIWGPPIVIVAVLSWLVCGPERAIDPYNPVSSRPPEEVDVVALNWKWLFIYPKEGIATVGVLAFPTDHQLSLHITSDSNMQSFFVPALGSQIAAMAGMVTRLHLVADRPVSIAGENTQYNGDGFTHDRFNVRVVKPGDFAQFVAAVRANGIPLTNANYPTLHKDGTVQDAHRALNETGAPADCVYFSSVPADFFRTLVTNYKDPSMGAMQAMDGG